MRLDKYLKLSRIIKRRSVANELCAAGRVMINGKVAKPGTALKVGDVLRIGFGNGTTTVRVTQIKEVVRKEEAASLYEMALDNEVGP